MSQSDAPTDPARVAEIRKNAELAVKYESFANAMLACRTDIPWLLTHLDRAEAERRRAIGDMQEEWKRNDALRAQLATAREALGKLRDGPGNKMAGWLSTWASSYASDSLRRLDAQAEKSGAPEQKE